MDRLRILVGAIAAAIAGCPAPAAPTPRGSDGWCAVTGGCSGGTPHAYKLCGTGEGAAPLPAACAGVGIVTEPGGAVCCP